MLSDQEMFDKVYTHLMTQGAKAVDGGACQLVDADGRKCAIGCLIPESVLEKIVKDGRAGYGPSIAQQYPELSEIFNPESGLLDDLRNIHDWTTVSEWGRKLRDVATRFNLTVPNDER